MKIKAAFLDIDGTLVSFRTHAMPRSAYEAIQRLRARGVKIFLCTGRNGDSTRFLTDLGLFDGQVLINGQLCEADGRCVYEAPISAADIETAVAGAQAGQWTLGFLSGHESFISRQDEHVLQACRYAGMAVPRVEPASLAQKMPIYQIHFYGEAGTEDALIERTEGLVAVRWSPHFADVFPKNGGKDRGIAAICAYLGISPAETIAFGDGENDISMLDYAGIGVAMGNASDHVKAHADYVAASVDEDGFARAVEHFWQYFV